MNILNVNLNNYNLSKERVFKRNLSGNSTQTNSNITYCGYPSLNILNNYAKASISFTSNKQQDEKNKIIQLYISGKSPEQITTETGIDKALIERTLSKLDSNTKLEHRRQQYENTQAHSDDIIKALNAGISRKEISARLGCPIWHIDSIINERRKDLAFEVKYDIPSLSDYQKKFIIEEYKKGATLTQIAKDCKLNTSAISKFIYSQENIEDLKAIHTQNQYSYRMANNASVKTTRKSRTIPEDIKDEIIFAYRNGTPINDIAEEYKFSKSAINNLLMEQDDISLIKSEHECFLVWDSFTKATRDGILAMAKSNISPKKIAQEYKCTTKQVKLLYKAYILMQRNN